MGMKRRPRKHPRKPGGYLSGGGGVLMFYNEKRAAWKFPTRIVTANWNGGHVVKCNSEDEAAKAIRFTLDFAGKRFTPVSKETIRFGPEFCRDDLDQVRKAIRFKFVNPKEDIYKEVIENAL